MRELLSDAMQFADMSFRELSRDTRIPAGSLCRFVAGKKSLSYENMLRLYDWLGYEVAD